MKIAMIFAALVLTTGLADAATIMLTTRYVITEYTVHRLTGATSGEITKDRTMDSRLEILPYKEDGESYIQFTAPAGTGIDRSGESVVIVPMSKREEMVDALKSLPKLCNAAKIKINPEDSSELLFGHDDLSLTFVTKKMHRAAYGDFVVGDRQYVLKSDKDVENLVKIIQSFK